MRRTLLLLITLLATTFCGAQTYQPYFTIKGKVENTDKSKIFVSLDYHEYDTTLNADKSFEIKGVTPYSHVMSINMESRPGELIWVNGGEINVTFEEGYYIDPTQRLLKVKTISGPLETVAYQRFYELFLHLGQRFVRVPEYSILDSMRNAIFPAIKKFVAENPSSLLSAHLPVAYELSDEHKKEIIRLLDKKVHAKAIEDMEVKIRKNDLVRPGALVADWKLPRPNGTLFSLYSVKARYILLQFWNANSGDCKRANEELLPLYKQYHPYGFEIVSIYLDTYKSDWLNGIKDGKLPWIHVSDLKGYKTKIATTYHIDEIPYSILIDCKHQIVETNLPVYILEAKLKGLFPIKN